MKPTLAFLITYYNEGALIRECLQGIVNQPDRPDEILIYDDHSSIPPDSFLEPEWNVRVIRGKQNRGPSFGRNELMKSTSADYIHFHDADDQCFPQWATKIRDAISDGAPDAIFTEMIPLRGNRLFTEHPLLDLKKLEQGMDLVRFCIEGALLPSAGTYRRQTILKMGGYNEQMWFSEDFHFHVRLAAQDIRFRVIVDPLVKKVAREESRSESLIPVWMGVVHSILLLSEELPEKYHQDLAEKAAIAGSKLFRLGDPDAAKEAFALASNLGLPTYYDRPNFYRWAAKILGPQVAERMGTYYRLILPQKMRRILGRSTKDQDSNARNVSSGRR